PPAPATRWRRDLGATQRLGATHGAEGRAGRDARRRDGFERFGASATNGTSRGGARVPSEGAVLGDDVARDPHADERDPGLLGAARRYLDGRAASPVRRRDPNRRRAAPQPD